MSNSSIIAVIACEVLEVEIRHFAAGDAHIRELVFLRQGLHNEPLRLQRELQAAILRLEADPAVDAIALGYGLCSRGVENLRHDRCPLVIARAHDCVTLLLGDRDRYSAYLRDHPGTYWYSPGWISSHTPPGPDRTALLRRRYAEKFDADDVEYLMAMEDHWIANYRRATYVGLGIGETQRDMDYTRHCAACLGWDYDEVKGDPGLLQALLRGDWDEQRFLVVPPRHAIRLTADDSIIRAEPETCPH